MEEKGTSENSRHKHQSGSVVEDIPATQNTHTKIDRKSMEEKGTSENVATGGHSNAVPLSRETPSARLSIPCMRDSDRITSQSVIENIRPNRAPQALRGNVTPAFETQGGNKENTKIKTQTNKKGKKMPTFHWQ